MLKSLFPWKHHKTKAMAAQQTMDNEVADVEFQSQELLPCHVCGRTFLPSPLKKHERICEKTSTKKRKPFDSLKQRVEGTDLADFHQKTYLKRPEPSPSPDLKKKSQSTWKEKHLALVSAIRAAKGIPSDVSHALPKTKSTTMAGTERCPSCDRQFGPKAYDRHVEWCKEKKAQQRIHHSPANVLLAKERLEARTKYVPPLNRSKKTIVREKYSNHASTETLISVKTSSPLSRGPSVRKPRSAIDMGKNNEKCNNNSEERKSKFDKNGTGGGDKVKTHDGGDRCVPVIGSPSSRSEILKSFQKRRTSVPVTKLNNVKVNNQFDGLTVASLIYDSSTKKMVTWKDTLKKTSTVVAIGEENFNECVNVSKSSNASLDATCKATQSEKLRKETKKLQCNKILSCSDVLHKNPPKKIPLSKYSFKSRLNLTDDRKRIAVARRTDDGGASGSNTTVTVKSSSTDLDDLNIDIDKQSSCNSVANAFEKLKIDSEHDLKFEEIEEIQLSPVSERKPGILDSESLVDVPLMDEIVVDTKSEFNLQNGHREMSDWFDEYMNKSEPCVEDATTIEEEETCDKNDNYTRDPSINATVTEKPSDIQDENLVLLFKSSTNLDLTKKNSEFTLPTKKSEEQLKNGVSQDSFTTNYDLDSIELSYRNPSHFSLKKSASDMYLDSTQSNMGLSNKNTLISIYWNKNREVSDEESLIDSRKTVSSLPNIRINEVVYKSEAVRKIEPVVSKTKIFRQNELLRRKILEIAAKEFVEDCHGSTAKENVRQEEESSCENPFLKFLEEEYTVPKKRRRVEDACVTRNKQKVFRFSVSQNFDLDKFKALTVRENVNVLEYRNEISENTKRKDDNPSDISSLNSVRSDSTLYGSSSAMDFTDYSPRIFAILDNVLNGERRPVSDKNLVVMTPSDCRRLIDLDKEKLPELERRLRKIKKRQARRCCDSLKLPAIEVRGHVLSEDKEVQVNEASHLPRIVDKKLRRRDNMKKLEVDLKKEIGDVYLEYDSERGNFNYNPFESAQRQFMELLECDDFKELAPTCTPVKHTQRPHTSDVTPTKRLSPAANKKTIKSAEPVLTKVSKKANRASVIEPPSSFKDSLDSIADDFELMENLINDNFTDDNKNDTNGFYLHLKSEKESLTLSDILNSRKYSDDMSTIDPMLINENDNLSIPEHFKIDDYSPTSTVDTDITIRNDIDCYSVQYDNKIAAFEPKVEKKSVKTKTEKKPVVKRSVSLVNRVKTDDSPLKATNKKLTNKTKLTSKSVSSITSAKTVTGDKKKGLSGLKRSMTLFDPSPKPPSLKNKNDVNNYFSEQEQKISMSIERNSPVKDLSDLLDETLKPEDLFNVDDEMYEEYKKYEEMYLKEKAQNSATRKHKPKIVDINLGIHTASEEEDHPPQFNKISNDSAYGSLTRKTPKHRSRATKLTPLEQKQADSTSSSGSENCPNSPAPANQRLSKFCHECGNKYPLTTAKFCVECGVKRLVL